MRRPYKITLIFVIFAGIYLLLPFGFGIAAHRYTENFLRNENQTLGKVLGIRLNFAEYNRGWFSSKAILQIEKMDSDGHYEIIRRIPVKISHGPSYRVDNRFWTGLGMIRSSELQIDPNDPYEFKFRENVGFNGERGAFILFSNKKNRSSLGDLQVGTLELHMNSDLQASQFQFHLTGSNLQFNNPQQGIAASIQNMQSDLEADYIGSRHWKLTFGLSLGKNQFSATNMPAALTVNVDKIDLSHLHFDTEKMANILGEVVQLKQAIDAQKPVQPTAWMALFQQFLTQIIQNDTWVDLKGITVNTPMGQIQAHYDASFPTLLPVHDYFDVATRNVGAMQIQVPSWKYTDTQANREFAISDFKYENYNNTVFSRNSKMTLGAFDVRNTKPTATATATALPAVMATGFSYQGELHGDVRNLSQTMQWKLARICFSADCFNQIQGELQLLRMNYEAFRGIAAATRQIVQYNPNQSESMKALWMNVASAYVKLISPESEVILSHDMITPEGKVKMHGELSWPGLTAGSAAPTLTTFFDQAVYEFHLLFPAQYVNAFLNQRLTQQPIIVVKPDASPETIAKKEPKTFEEQVAQFVQYSIEQGYLKKVGDTYVMDLAGKGADITINGTKWKMPT